MLKSSVEKNTSIYIYSICIANLLHLSVFCSFSSQLKDTWQSFFTQTQQTFSTQIHKLMHRKLTY